MNGKYLFFYPAKSLLAATGIVLLSFVQAQVPAAGLPALKGTIEDGRQRYIEYQCYACHGYSGETGNAARLNPPRLNQVAFIAYVRNPPGQKRGFRPGSIMPSYSGPEVSDQDLADIYAWLQFLPSTSPPVKEIPLLRDL